MTAAVTAKWNRRIDSALNAINDVNLTREETVTLAAHILAQEFGIKAGAMTIGQYANLVRSAPHLLAALERMHAIFAPQHEDPEGLTVGGQACLAAAEAIDKAKS